MNRLEVLKTLLGNQGVIEFVNKARRVIYYDARCPECKRLVRMYLSGAVVHSEPPCRVFVAIQDHQAWAARLLDKLGQGADFVARWRGPK